MEAEEERTGKVLIDASRPYATEDLGLSWRYTISTFTLMFVLAACSAFVPYTIVRVVAAVLNGLVLVRGFILYHDHMHGALLRKSPVARALFSLYGTLLLTPPRVWRQTHNYHHANTAKIIGSHIGSYPMVTVDMWRQMNFAQRLKYRLARHPLTIFMAPLTLFVYGMCLSSFVRDPKRHWDSLVSLLLHVAIAAALIGGFGFGFFFYVYYLPLWIATAAGGYLFYAQHNFPDIEVLPREEWSYTHAAIHSSSHLVASPLMHWFTGNIGYHHVHHLNSMIPFYRLPEAMAGISELQSPHTTSLMPSDIIACFRLKLWDPQLNKMVAFPRQTVAKAQPAG